MRLAEAITKTTMCNMDIIRRPTMAKEELKDEEILEEEELEEELDEDEGLEDEDESKDDKSDKKKGSKSHSNKTFTQSHVNRMMAKEKQQGREAAYRAIGIDPKNKEQVKLVKGLIGSLSGKGTGDDTTGLEESLKEANLKALKSEIKAQAIGLGVRRDCVEDVATLILSKSADDEEEMSEENIASLVGEYKTKYPAFFKELDSDDDEDSEDKSSRKKGTGTSINSKSGGKKDKKDKPGTMATRLLGDLPDKDKKSSFWG